MIYRCPVLYLLCGLLLILTDCAPNLHNLEPEDLTRYSQDPRSYLSENSADTILLSQAEQQSAVNYYRRQFFRPWHSHGPLLETEHPFWAVDWIGERRVFDLNLRPLVAGRRDGLIGQADQEHYPSMAHYAISVVNTSLRALPTVAPLFNDPHQAGEGFPFDILQHSAIPLNTPLLITHRSRDGEWLFAEAPAYYGWLPAHTVAWVDETLIARFEALPLLTCVTDKSPLIAANGSQVSCPLGTLLPILKASSNEYTVLRVVADVLGQGRAQTETIVNHAAAQFPLQPTPRNMARLAQTVMGQPYDWGGRYGWRDCSATVRDLFSPFGIWLPRNSSQQATVGRQVDLRQQPENIEELIRAQGLPFFSLINLRGHVMLYLGNHGGQPLALHTIWGLATHPFGGDEGRWVIGRTVITSLHPGQEQAGLLLSIRDLASRVKSLSFPLDNSPEN